MKIRSKLNFYSNTIWVHQSIELCTVYCPYVACKLQTSLQSCVTVQYHFFTCNTVQCIYHSMHFLTIGNTISEVQYRLRWCLLVVFGNRLYWPGTVRDRRRTTAPSRIESYAAHSYCHQTLETCVEQQETRHDLNLQTDITLLLSSRLNYTLLFHVGLA